MDKKLAILVFTFVVSLPLALVLAQTPEDQPKCYCRMPCQSMVPPEFMDCKLYTEPPSRGYYCPGLCKENATYIICPLPFSTPRILPIDGGKKNITCPPYPGPRWIVGEGVGILPDFSDFVYLKLNYFIGKWRLNYYRGYLSVNNVNYELGNISLDYSNRSLSAVIYSSNQSVGTINLTLTHKFYVPYNRRVNIVEFSDIAVGNMTLYNNDYKVFLFGRVRFLPVPIPIHSWNITVYQ